MTVSRAQEPLRDTPFDAASTAEEVAAGIDLTGRVAVVTGGHSGIGRETTRVLRARGADVVVPVRDPAKAAGMLEGVEGVEIDRLDLADPESVDAFAAGFLAGGRQLDIVVNSAGIMGVPLTRDVHGHESHFATNHLGHFRLTARLSPVLAPDARVVSVSAAAHRLSPVVFDDVDFERREYQPMLGYGQSKTANILFALELDRRGIRAFSVHPGSIVETNLSGWAAPETLRAMKLVDEDGKPVIDPYSGKKNVPQGAATSVWCAVSPQLDGFGGVYCVDNNIAPVAAESGPDARSHGTAEIPTAGVSPHATDPGAAARLWELSERLTGVAFQARL
ncbi:SDR family NAD(P)-dependent oxidoreductase [Amycolatopsis sp., V23-08]|uniref:SDR family NAD(P)-dependent oxidoreductase n=1 Tax=Amycolatopsis heterodermiae TaxID=3110235 RepID=A0ABU5R5A4_9PSEU|nr:SDR family NAD(P)-dependent oxidoreductase [Amycolatopsis sp., V23-08]MEA5360471.1 SDR family NAD(P)-dependent oxidoreductase [Amycolatopsis sp., V23-08]